MSLSIVLAACGGGGDDEVATDPTPAATSEAAPSDDGTDDPTTDAGLTEDDLAPALLTPADLPDGYVVDPDPGDEESESFVGTCLEDVGNLTDQPEFEADAKAKASYVLDADAGQSSIESQVQSYVDQDQVVSAVAMFAEVVGACTEATGTDPDGTSYDLKVLSDQTVSLSGVDEQARVAINGTITSGGQELPVNLGYNVARIANNLVIVSTLDLGEVGEGIVPATDTTAQVSVDRLAEITG